MNQDPDNERVELPGSDDESLREYGRQLALDSLLELALGNRVVGKTSAVPARPLRSSMRARWQIAVMAVAPVAIVVAVVVLIWLLPKPRPPIHQIDVAQDVVGPVLTQVANWKIESNGPNAFQIIAPRRIRLDSGELHITSAGADDDDPLLIETTAGIVTAGQTDCFVGAHEFNSSPIKGPPMLNHLTRVLVFAGIATLANPHGTSSGGPGHLLAAERDNPPADHVIQSNSDFAFDLYAQLARNQPEKNLFFSPYSMSTALTMAAEGARGETAGQMGRVLRFPDAARRVGGDAQVIPFNVSLMHTGYSSLNERFNRTEDAATRKVRQQIDTLRKDLAEANRKAAALRKDGKNEESNRFALESQRFAGQLNSLLTQVDQFELRVANAVWAEKSYPLSQRYIDTINRFYKTGGVFPLDFRNDFEGSRRRINAWVDEQTSHRISELIPERLMRPEDRDRVRMVLTNAIYFKGEWSQVFPADQTREEEFLLSDGATVRVPMMHHGNLGSAGYAAFNGDGTLFKTPTEVPADGAGQQPAVYPDDRGFALIELPYKGGDLSMVLIAPRLADSLPAVEKLLTPAHLADWLQGLQSRTVNTFVPRFKMETSYEMSDVLTSLGMVRAFIDPSLPGGGQFGGMCESQDPAQSLYIGKVLHQALVEVTEKGTEAAAATAVITVPPPGPRPEMVPFTPVFRADRPFALVIRDRKSGSILFMGRVLNPK